MKRCNRSLAWMIVFSLVLSIFSGTGVVLGANTTIRIQSVNDLKSLAKKCKLDTWSVGKVVELTADIDCSGTNFEMISTFAGIFEGNGHTITGLNFTTDGSNMGLFRYIQKGAMVKNLTVKGNVVPGGSKKNVGGLVGTNYGTLKNCIFVGTVKGDNYIGGLVGINEATGQIINCTTLGVVIGEHYSGGIAGENLGTILYSKNKMSVNTTVEESLTTLENLEKINIENTDFMINSTENTNVKTDTGGIAGFSTGIIQGCQNFGIIGYPHMGYNVGGIVGRQSGYINDCTNLGEIYGRKDVGGLVGQMEPYLSLEFSSDEISNLKTELSQLQDLMDKAINDTTGLSSDLTDELSATKIQVDQALDKTHDLANQTETIFNESIDSVNELSARVSDTLQSLVPIMDEADTLGEQLDQSIDKLREVLDTVEAVSDEGEQLKDQLDESLDDLQNNIKDYTSAVESISDALKKVKNAIGDEDETEAALDTLERALGDLSSSFKSLSKGLNTIAVQMETLKNLVEKSGILENLVIVFEESSKALEEMNTAITQMQAAIQKIIDATDETAIITALVSLQKSTAAFTSATTHLTKALAAIDPDNIMNSDLATLITELTLAINDIQTGQEALQTALNALQNAVSPEDAIAAQIAMQQALESLSKSIQSAQSANEKLSEILKALQGTPLDEVKSGLEEINKGVKQISDAVNEMSDGISNIQDAIHELKQEVSLTKIKSALTKTSEALGDLSDAMEKTEGVIEDLKKVSDKAKDVGDKVDDTVSKTREFVDLIKEASTTANNLTDKTYDLITDLANKPTITFPNLDSKYINTADALNNALGNVSDAMGNINDTVDQYSHKIITDVQAISNQFFVVTNLLINMTIDREDNDLDLEEYKKDISDVDTEKNTQGKVFKSVNQGEIAGDVNVGGIAGAMAIEYDLDPEDDIKKEGARSFNFQYLARAVIRGCTNKGNVTSKKNYVGGIVGRMDLGTVMSSNGYGNIKSESGNYVGGIAGASYSHITKSFTMSVLSGSENVGGIAGFATKLTNNYAMVDIESANESKGAIAGNIDKLEDGKENYFVDRGIGGIDDISYTGKAEPLSYEAFRKVKELPEEFTNLYVTFVVLDEDEEKIIQEVARVPFEFGGSIDEKDIPKVPEKKGYYGKWEDFNKQHLTFSTNIAAVYAPYTTTLASNMKQDGKSLALLEGTFEADTVLSLVSSEVAPPKGVSEKAEVWQVTITGANYTKEHNYKLHLLATQKGKVHVYILQEDGSFKKISAKKNGSYVIVSMLDDSQTFCVDYENNTLELIFSISGGLLALGILIGILRKRRKVIS